MRKLIDADRLRAEIEKRIKATMGISHIPCHRREELQGLLSFVDSLQKEVELPPVVTLSKFPSLRQAIEEQMYSQIVRKIPGCPPHAGITVSFTLRPSTVRNLKKDYEQNGIPATAVGKVFTNTDPKNLYVESDKWNALLGQFENGQRVRIILVKEDEE